MLTAIKKIFRTHTEVDGFAFSRPLVVLQSDDWGRVGVRDREGYEYLRAHGLRLGERPYDLYSLETADDVCALAAMLRRHRDSTERPPCVIMNVCTANLDFEKMRDTGFRTLHLLPLANGLPANWSRPGLVESYRAGIEEGLFRPGLHGVTHFCSHALATALAENGERAHLLRLLWQAGTPYIFWRMPWVGYEYWNPEKPHSGFLSREAQQELVRQACKNFSQLFGVRPTSACAPGCRSNENTHRAWAAEGIYVGESGSGSGLHPPHIDEYGVLHTYRSFDFEPSQRELEVEKYLEIAAAYFSRGLPVVISVHSINFHSTLKDFRSRSIAALDQLLTALEKKYPELLYVNDEDLYGIVTEGAFHNRATRVKVTVRRQGWNPRFVHEGAL